MRLGLRMGLNSRQGGGSALDADARLYIAAVETALGTPIATALPSATSNPKRIISDFIKAEKAASRWSLHKRIYLPIYANAAASAIDMVSQNVGTFTASGVTHAAGYVNGDGSTGYFNSGIGLPAVGGSNASASMWAIIPQRVIDVNRYEGVNGSSTERISIGSSSGNLNQWICPSTSSVASSTAETSAGTMIGSSISTSSRFIKIRTSGSFITASNSTLNTTTIPSANLFFLARNNNGLGALLFHPERRGGYGFGLGLTEVQSEEYAVNLETLYEGLTGIALP